MPTYLTLLTSEKGSGRRMAAGAHHRRSEP
jgi:hypothetical protein